MTISDLHKKLQDSYCIKNLNNISLTLINLYKNKQFNTLQKIAETINDIVDIDIADDGKGFSKLIMLYHPDRRNNYLEEIDNLTRNNDFDGLLKHSHILRLERIEEIASSISSMEDIDYTPVYEWDTNLEGYSIVNEQNTIKKSKSKAKSKPQRYNFFNAMKIRQYGHLGVNFPDYYLEDIDEFELSSSGINDLDGIQYCKHAKIIDLSGNFISDITLLNGLSYLEELNLSDNQIDNIDVLNNLENLRRIDLSNNQISDISPLFDLNNLDFIDLTDNSISKEQIHELTELGVNITY